MADSFIPLTIDEYARQAALTDQRKGKHALSFSMLGVFGEAGSLLSEVKKKQRDKASYLGYADAVAEELGDVLWYLASVARRSGLPLSAIAASAVDATRLGSAADNDLTFHALQPAHIPITTEPTTKYKVMAFTIGSLFAGLAGGLHAHYFYTIQPNTFNFLKSFDILVMVVLGGQGSITGSIIAAIALTILSASLQKLAALRLVIYALLLIVVMLFRPQGLMGTKEFSFSMFSRKSKDKEGKQHGTAIGQ